MLKSRLLKLSVLAGSLIVCVHSAAAQSNTYSTRTVPDSWNIAFGRQHPVRPKVYTQEEIASDSQFRQGEACDVAGEEAFQQGNSLQAEVDFREAVALEEGDTRGYEGLGKTLASEGRTEEAIQVYRKIFYDLSSMQFANPAEREAYTAKVYANPVAYGGTGSASCEDGLRYALLLNATGQWAEAVTVYESALPRVPCPYAPKLDVHFRSDTPQTLELEAATHLALGLTVSEMARRDAQTSEQSCQAMQEYSNALRLEPEWPIANYYYSYGWHHLEPADQAKFGTAQQAKAALQKAVKVGKGNVKAAAQKALKEIG